MIVVIEKATGRVIRDNWPMVPDFDEDTGDMIPDTFKPAPREGFLVAPDLGDVTGIDQKYWKLDGDAVVSMTPAEKTAADASELAKAKAKKLHGIQFHSTREVEFQYDGKTFTLESQQREQLAMFAGVAAMDYAGNEFDVTADDGTVVELDTFARFSAFRSAAAGAVLGRAKDAKTAEAAVTAASDMSAVDAVVVPKAGGRSRRA